MSEIARYRPFADDARQRPDGDYVLYTDHIAALEAVKAELDAATSDENRGLWRFWNDKARELTAKLEAVKATVKLTELDDMVSSAIEAAIETSPEFNYGWRSMSAKELIHEILDEIPIEYTEQNVSEAIYRYKVRRLTSDPTLEEKPVANLVWLQAYNGTDDVQDYYEVARPGDKCVDGSDPFPVYMHPPAIVPSPALEASDREIIAQFIAEGWAGSPSSGDLTANDYMGLGGAHKKADELIKRLSPDRNALEANPQVIETLRAALEPFARKFESVGQHAIEAGFDPSFDEYECDWTFSFGDLRRARAAYTTQPEPTRGQSNE